MVSPLTLVGGLTLGLASSLHCVGMCGGIAAMSLMPAGPSVSIARTAAAVHAGRISAYSLLGGLAGGLGTVAVHGLEPSLGHHLLRWAAALSLGWIGLSTAGLMPGPGALARFVPACGGVARYGRSAFLAGFGWGLLPCAMVYGALLYALFTGSALSGALVMAGFGVGTLPALAGAATIFKGLRAARGTIGARPGTRLAIGFGIALLGPISLAAADPSIAAACRAIGL